MDGAIGDPAVKVYWYTTDHLGSVKAVTDNTGKVVFQADHLAFGQRYNESGDFDEWHSFTGKEFDPETGLYYFNARWYDQETGRFISEDPVGDPNNPNLYSYCGNNPLNQIDPTGTKSTEEGLPDEFDGGNKPAPPSPPSPPSSSGPKNLWTKFSELLHNIWNWSDSKDLNWNSLLEKSENGDYYEEYENWANTPFSGPLFYGVNPGEEYGWLINKGKLDPDKVSLRDFINQMGPIWEYNSRTRTVGQTVTGLAETAFIYLAAIETLNMGVEAFTTLGLLGERAYEIGKSQYTLYRAVSEEEYEQIMKTGKFEASPNSLGGKFFAEQYKDAVKWGDKLQGEGNYKIITLKVDSGVQYSRWDRLDAIGPARYYELEYLNKGIIGVK